MATDQVHIYSTGNLYRAELVRQILSDNDIQSFIINKQDSVYMIGDIELYAHRDHVIRAKMLIREFEEN